MTVEISFVSLDDIRRLLDKLPLQEKETLLAEKLQELPAESKLRVLGLSNSGLAVITGSFVCLNSDVAVNIQNGNSGGQGFDAETLFKALAEFKKPGGR